MGTKEGKTGSKKREETCVLTNDCNVHWLCLCVCVCVYVCEFARACWCITRI